MRGTSLPETVVPFKAEYLTLISATGSKPKSLLLNSSISAPMFFNTSMMPVLVGLIPTSLITTSEPSTIDAATRKNAAEDMSPGTTISPAFNLCPPFMLTVKSFSFISALKALNILSVWSRDFIGSVMLVSPSA